MSGKTPKLPKMDKPERTPLVTELIEIVQHQSEVIQVLRGDLADLNEMARSCIDRPFYFLPVSPMSCDSTIIARTAPRIWGRYS